MVGATSGRRGGALTRVGPESVPDQQRGGPTQKPRAKKRRTPSKLNRLSPDIADTLRVLVEIELSRHRAA